VAPSREELLPRRRVRSSESSMSQGVWARRWQADALAAYLEPAFRALGQKGTSEASSTLPQQLRGAAESDPVEWNRLYDLYATTANRPPTPTQPPAGLWRGAARWFQRNVWNAPAVVFLLVTGLATSGYVFFRTRPEWQVPAVLGFLVLLLALLPGFLYLRFIRFRIGPLCDEYVYNLHRLGVDETRYLPEPVRASAAWTRWNETGGPGYRTAPPSIYARKFESQYGRWPMSDHDEHQDDLGRLMSVYLCLATLVVGWAFVIWSAPVADALPRLVDALRFGFLGAYFFLLSLLIRRYFQNDLRPGAYLAGVVRIVTVLVLVAGVDQVFALSEVPADRPYAPENAVAFLVGVFPTVGVQLIRRAVGKITGRFRGGLEPPFPLSQLDGMDIWSESRLAEIGIEDVQHLATANLIDVILGARIPTQRIVDWVDQALLLLRTGLPRIDNLSMRTTYGSLRAIGVRTSTDLLDLVDELDLDLGPDGRWPSDGSPAGPLAAVPDEGGPVEGPPSLADLAKLPLLIRMALAATTLQHEPNLRLVMNWQRTAPEGAAEAGEPSVVHGEPLSQVPVSGLGGRREVAARRRVDGHGPGHQEAAAWWRTGPLEAGGPLSRLGLRRYVGTAMCWSLRAASRFPWGNPLLIHRCAPRHLDHPGTEPAHE
jgi:hypothetical protein